MFVSSTEPTVWYPDSGTTNHVCQETSALNKIVKFSSTSPLLIGDGSCATIENLGWCTIPTNSKLLHLNNVLHVPKIQKNLMYVSQFALENYVFFEFHPFHYLVKDV